jgi:hypothetical protein
MILRIYKILRIFSFISFLIISIYASQFYEGSILIFGSYCFFLLLTIFYLTDSKATYFEIFFSCYFFLGFWFKYIFSLLFYNGHIFESGEDKSVNIDEVLILVIFISFVCLTSSFVNKNFFTKNVKKKEKRTESFFENFYLSNRNLILISFILLIITVGFLNNKFGIYQRGFAYVTDNFFYINNFIKWLLLFGLTTFSCFVIHIEILNYKKINIFTIIVAFFEIFVSYTTMLSRSFVINGISLILPIYQKFLLNKKICDKKFIFLFIILIFLTLISLYLTNYIRLSTAYAIENEIRLEELRIKELNLEISKAETLPTNLHNQQVNPQPVINFIIINRWIGIESLIRVHNYKKKSFDLFFKAFGEDKNNLERTFYEKTFSISKDNVSINQKYVKGNTLPGIISFLYYSGNIYFVLIFIFIIFFLFNFIERIIRKITQENIIFCCFLSNMIATRLFHFGYAPKDTYLFILSILLSLLLITFLIRFRFPHSLHNK